MTIDRKEPEYREEISLFDSKYFYLGNDGQEARVESKSTGEVHTFGYWEFVEGWYA